MITLRDWMETVNYRITEGSEFGWECYGPNAHSLSAWNGINGKGGWSFNIVFDTKDQTVYEAEVCDYTNDRAYRIINQDYKKAYDKESKDRGEIGDQAWDDVNYTELESDEDWLDKADAIVDGREYDTRVSVPIDMPEDELFILMKRAHEKDITLNQLVEEAIKEAIKEYERDPEGMKARAQQWKKNKVYGD